MMRRSSLCAALCLTLAPLLADAKGGALQHRPNKDFRELIVKGERPEIAACMAAAVEKAYRGSDQAEMRWDADASDHALMRESEHQGRIVRTVEFETEIRSGGGGLLAADWQRTKVSCVQPEDAAVEVRFTPAKG